MRMKVSLITVKLNLFCSLIINRKSNQLHLKYQPGSAEYQDTVTGNFSPLMLLIDVSPLRSLK